MQAKQRQHGDERRDVLDFLIVNGAFGDRQLARVLGYNRASIRRRRAELIAAAAAEGEDEAFTPPRQAPAQRCDCGAFVETDLPCVACCVRKYQEP